jgi:hypothetical protein
VLTFLLAPLEQLVVGSFAAAMDKSPRSAHIESGPARADTRKDVAEAADGIRRTCIVNTSKIDYGTSRLRPRHRLCSTHDPVCFYCN